MSMAELSAPVELKPPPIAEQLPSKRSDGAHTQKNIPDMIYLNGRKLVASTKQKPYCCKESPFWLVFQDSADAMLCEVVEMEDASDGANKARLPHVDSGAMDGAVDALTDEEGSRSSDSFFPDDANVTDINVLDTGALFKVLEQYITAANASRTQEASGAYCYIPY